jgi:hypothetical protein
VDEEFDGTVATIVPSQDDPVPGEPVVGRDRPASARWMGRLGSFQLAIRVLAALTWLFWSSRLFVEIGIFPTAAVWAILYGVGAIVLLMLYMLVRSDRALGILDNVLVGGTLLIGIIWVIALVYGNPNYGTDEAAFVQGAAKYFAHGHNPYGLNLESTLQNFAVQPSAYTYTASGHLITHLNYPSMSFLPESALIALGVTSQTTIWVCAVFLAASGLVLLAVVPRAYRPLAALLLAFDAYFNAAAAGLIFTEMMVFLVIAIVSWESFVTRAPGWRGWIAPVALGIAVSIQQYSWFLVPCFFVAAYQEARLRQRRPWPDVFRYGGITFGVFFLLNLPFIVMDLSTWIHGILEPMSLPLVPLGQGLIGLTNYFGLGGGNLGFYSVASVLVYLTLLLVIGFHYDRTRFLVPMTPAIVLWFSTRSLSQYVLIAAFALLAAQCCWRREGSEVEPTTGAPVVPPAPWRLLPDRVRLIGGASLIATVLISVGLVAIVGTMTVAFIVPGPLSLRIISFHSTGQEQTIDSLTVDVRNNTDAPKSVVYIVEDGPYLGTPWLIVGGNRIVPARSHRIVRVLAPNSAVMPSLNGAFKVAAFTTGPTAVSTSGPLQPNANHTLLTPFGFPTPIPVGVTKTVQVQVVNRLGVPVRQAGIEVQLGQAVYSPAGLFATENSINGQPDGQSPVGAPTNGQGVAVFTVRADQPGGDATTLQAWLGTAGATGYSNRVIAWFGYAPSEASQ